MKRRRQSKVNMPPLTFHRPQYLSDFAIYDLQKLAFTKLHTKHLQYPHSLANSQMSSQSTMFSTYIHITYLPFLLQYSPFAGGRGNVTRNKLETISPVYANISKISKEKATWTTILIAIGRIRVKATFMLPFPVYFMMKRPYKALVLL